MDISNITDIDKLKSMAYDEVVAKARAEENLRVIEGRMIQLRQSGQTETPEKDQGGEQPQTSES